MSSKREAFIAAEPCFERSSRRRHKSRHGPRPPGGKERAKKSVTREEDRGMVAFASRRKAIERVGLPEVCQSRPARCDAEELNDGMNCNQCDRSWEIRPLLVLNIVREEQ